MVELELQPHGWFRLVFPLFLRVFRRAEKANIGRIREVLERREQAQTPP